MSTTIDSIQIEIQSNSNQAAQGIDALAKAMGELKKNGTITTAVKNLKELSSTLRNFTSVASNANKISGVANALRSLKEIGSLTGTSNGVTKMAESLGRLSSVNVTALEKVANSSSVFERVAASLGKLSGIKAGGLSTMVNALAKIGDVTDRLDDNTINAFADRVEKLNAKLTPLSTKMTTIQSGLRGLNSSAKSASSGVKQLGNDVNATTLNLTSLITIAKSAYSALQPVVRLLHNTIKQAIEWDGVAARFGRGFGSQAQDTYEWIQLLNKEMGINVQQFMQYSSVYATMLTGFGVAMEDAGKMALGYTELTYDIWAGYNDIYKTYADAAEAVKSAIAGEVEPIRRAGFTIVEATLKQTAANHDLEVSLANATEAQKSYLRYLTLVDQAHAQGLVGTYAKELETAEGLMRTLSQQVKSLAQAFGSLFLPILVQVIPYVQAFVELLTEAVYWIASVFGVEMQKVDWSGYGDGMGGLSDSADDVASSMGSAAQAAKDLKKATIGIDELNVISPPTASGGSGAGGSGAGFDGLDVDSLWDKSIFKEIGNKVDEIKEKMKSWLGVTNGIDSWADFFQSKLGKILTAVGLVGGAFAAWKVSKGVITLLDKIENIKKSELFKKIIPVLKNIGKWLLVVAGVVTTAEASAESWEGGVDWGSLGQQALGNGMAIGGGFLLGGPGGGIASIIVGIIDLLGSVKSAVKDGNEEWSNTLSIIMGISAIGGGISVLLGSWIPVAVAGVVATLATIAIYADDIWAGLKTFFGETLPKFFTETIPAAFTDAWEAVKTFFTEDVPAFFTETIPEWGNTIAYNFGFALGSAVKAMTDWWNEDVVPFFTEDIPKFFTETLPEWGENIKEGFKTALANAKTAITTWWDEDVVPFFKEDIPRFFKETLPKFFKEDIPTAFKAVGEWIVEGLWGGIVEKWRWLKDTIKGWIDNFVQGFKDGLGIASPSTVFAEIGGWIVDGLWGGIEDWWGDLVEAVSDWIEDLIDVDAVLEKLSGAWESVKSWFGGDSNKEEKVAVGVSLKKDGWSSVKSWIGSIPAISQAISLAKSGWSSVKNWVGSMPKLNASIGLIKSGWTKVSTWIGTMPTLSAKISLIKNGWTSIKNWLGNLNFNLGFKLPKIGINWGTKKVAGFEIKYPSGFYTYAKGGFPSVGELFIANEAGPEMIGRIGNKSAVANNEQIVSAISDGVYAAVLAAMKSGDSKGQSVNVYLDGRQIASSVEKHQHERGASLMGNQVYAY